MSFKLVVCCSNDLSSDSCSDEVSCLEESELSCFGGKVEVADFCLSLV